MKKTILTILLFSLISVGVNSQDEAPDGAIETFNVLFRSAVNHEPFAATPESQEAKTEFLTDCSANNEFITCTAVSINNGHEFDIEMGGTPKVLRTQYLSWLQNAWLITDYTLNLEKCSGANINCALAGHCLLVNGQCKAKCIFLEEKLCIS